jgi:dihydrodipicolinate synthase/N-acetylneuraminate lyase
MPPSRRKFLKSSTLALGATALGLTGSGTVWAAASKKQGNCPPEVREALSGPWPSISTPFTRHGEIDYPSLYKMLDFMIEEGKAKAVVLTGGDSLFSLLTDDEIARLTKEVSRHVKGRAYFVAATDRWWTGKTAEFAKYSQEVGADMLMVWPPDWAASTTVDTLVDHYAAAAKHIHVMLVTGYLKPRGIPFALELVKRLCEEVPGVVAMKDEVSGVFARKICLATSEHWAVSAAGQKQKHMNMLPYGATGYLSTIIQFKPEIAWRYWNAIQAGDLQAASAVIRDYDMPLFDYLIKLEGSFDAGIHGIFELFGLAKRYRRAPYYSLNDRQMEQLADHLKKIQLL